MALLEISEVEERTAMKQLFEYVYLRALGSSGHVNHYHDSTWEHACRFLWRFDPEGETQIGYSPEKKLSEIQDYIDESDLASLPCIEAFLDTALSMNTHFHGVGAKSLYQPMTFDLALTPILQAVGLIGKDGTATNPLLIDAIDRWHFFDEKKRRLMPEATEFLDRVGEAAWRDASNEDKEYFLSGLKNAAKSAGGLQNWFTSRWRFGVWLNNGEWEKDSDLFGSHSAMGWLMVASLKTGLEEGRIQPR